MREVSTVLPAERARADAIAFLIDAYDGVRVCPGKGLPHAQAVADIVQSAGGDERAQLVGLLHDVVEDTRCTVDDVREVFGEEVAEMVAALTENSDFSHYAQRKR